MKTTTIAAQLNDKVFRSDFPRMTNHAFEAALKTASYVSNALSAGNRKQFYISFVALRRVLSMTEVKNLVVVGPKLMDFQSVVQEVSGLGVVMVNEGLWFFNMLGRHPGARGEFTVKHLTETFGSLTHESTIVQFIADPDAVDNEPDAE